MNKGFSKAYYLWHSPSKGDLRKSVEYICTRDGREISRTEWCRIAREMITEADKTDLLNQIKEYVQISCVWLKKNEIEEYAMDCLLKGSYKHWRDFCYQERIGA